MAQMMSLKSGYITTMRGVNALSGSIGLNRWLDARRDGSRLAHWARSLGAIYDLDALVALDVPWWTYNAIDVVSEFLEARPGARVFEYGSGASTIWLARRAGRVTSVEHHADWHASMRDVLAVRDDICPVDLRLVAPDAAPADDPLYISEKAREKGQSFAGYASAIGAESDALYDLIVIDGRARNACLAHAADHLAPDGMIVFDNTGRSRYMRAIEASGLSAQHLRGLTPALPYPDKTTLLRKA